MLSQQLALNTSSIWCPFLNVSIDHISSNDDGKNRNTKSLVREKFGELCQIAKLYPPNFV